MLLSVVREHYFILRTHNIGGNLRQCPGYHVPRFQKRSTLRRARRKPNNLIERCATIAVEGYRRVCHDRQTDCPIPGIVRAPLDRRALSKHVLYILGRSYSITANPSIETLRIDQGTRLYQQQLFPIRI